MQDSRLPTAEIGAVKIFSGLLDVPSEDMPFGRFEFLIFLNQANELRIADHFIR